MWEDDGSALKTVRTLATTCRDGGSMPNDPTGRNSGMAAPCAPFVTRMKSA